MNVLIVYAHPSPQSFNAAMRDVAVETLTAAGHAVVVSDLVALDFKAVTDASDFAGTDPNRHFSVPDRQQAAFEAGTTAPDIAAEHAKVKAAGLVLFQFPMWIYSMPAILKGWVERVMSQDFAHSPGHMFETGHMAGKRAMLCVTTNGRGAAFSDTGFHGPMELLLWPIHNGLRFQGFDILPPFVAYDVVRVDAAARGQVLSEFRKHLEATERARPIDFHLRGEYAPDGRLKDGVAPVTRVQGGPAAGWVRQSD
ncbi:MAG TPA: NAD(P)H-dependent oxidoreductase [Alphaproteobacteria bacterium]|nr:NAD(P)H-dependent oxidoreductase [Alphaproteobacteria bacterium]